MGTKYNRGKMEFQDSGGPAAVIPMKHVNLVIDELSSVAVSPLASRQDRQYSVYFRGVRELPLSEKEGREEDGHLRPILLFLHGGGHTGKSFTMASQELARLHSDLIILSPDLPAHGMTVLPEEDNLSMDRLVADSIKCLSLILKESKNPLVLVGFSLGGAIAIRLAHEAAFHGLCELKGLVVVEMSEGSAIASIAHMKETLKGFPTHFSSQEEAIQWSLSKGILQNEESARISVPAQLKEENTPDGSSIFVWRTKLISTEKFWVGWFSQLSDSFLALKQVPKLVMFSNYDRLDADTTLCAGQMEGRFELQILGSHHNHHLHEDHPLLFARTVYRFCRRNQILR